MTFQESHKASSANSPSATRQLSVPERGLDGKRILNNSAVRKLIRMNLQDADTREDATIVLEDGNVANYEGHDAPHFSNANVSLASITSDGINTAINFMPDASEVDSIRLHVSGSTNPAIKLSITDFAGAGNRELVLLDRYAKTSTVLNIQNNSHTFGVDRGILASFGRDRFVLLFKKKAALSMDDRRLKAAVQNNGVLVSWTTVSESESREFVVERSQDGQNFFAIGTRKAAGTSTGEIRYSFIDSRPLEGVSYYRLRKVDVDGTMAYSNAVNVTYGLQTQGSVSVYPNPVKGELNINWKTNEIVDIGIYDMAGKLVRTYENLKGSDFKADASSLTTGSYIIKIRNKKTGREFAANKFIKE